jgi:virulence-associated protein VagC
VQAIRANLFQNEGGQAISLSKECRFTSQRKGSVRRVGWRVILEAADAWSDKFRACLCVWRGKTPVQSSSQ